MKKSRRIKLIIFDLWKTLVYRDVEKDAHIQMLNKFNLKFSEREFTKIFENSIQTKKWKSEFEAYKNLARNAGLLPLKENARLLMKIRKRAEAKTKLYLHTIKMLKMLKKQGYKIGILSNSSVFVIDRIKKKFSLMDYVDYPLFSFDVGIIKPSTKGFREILKKAKCNPKEAIMIGDKISDDVIPARKVGISAIHFKNYPQLKRDFLKFGINI